MEISSTPMTLTAGVPILRSCSLHVLLVQLLDRPPIQVRFLSNVFDRHGPTAPPHKESKSLAVERIVRKPLQLLLLHLHAPPAIDSAHLDLQVDSIIPTRQIPHPTPFAIVPPSLDIAAGTANCFFPRRRKPSMRAFGSPKIPRTVELGLKPGNRYVSHKRRYFRIPES